MAAIKFLLGLLILIFLVTFALKNMEPEVTISYYFGYSFGPLPFFFSMLAAAVVGAMFAVVFLVVEQIKLRRNIRRHSRRIAELEKELLEFRQIPPEPLPAPGAIPSPQREEEEPRD